MKWRGLISVCIWTCASLMACDIQDVSPVLTLETHQGETGRSWIQPYLGHIGVAWTLDWEDPSPEAIDVLWQARTSGLPETEACLGLQNPRGTPLQLVPSTHRQRPTSEAPPRITLRPGSRPLEGRQGSESDPLELELQSTERNRWKLTFQGLESTPEIVEVDGSRIALEELPVEDPLCGNARRYEVIVEAGTYVLRVPQESVEGALHLERPCEETRPVPATCPGHVGPLIERQVTGDGERPFEDWVSAVELGAGDTLSVALRCRPAERCSLRLTQSQSLEPLGCRTSGDCGPGSTCTTEGRCLDGSGCSIPGGGRQVHWSMPLLLLGLLFARSRRRFRGTWAILLIAPTLLLASPRTGIAQDSPRLSESRQVTLHAGAGQRRVVGQGHQDVDPGLSLVLGHGLQFGRYGFLFEAGLDSALVQGPSPPSERGLQLSSFTLTPRTALQWKSFRLLMGPSWLRTSPLVNALPSLLGPRRHHHGLGAQATLRIEHLAPLFLEGTTEYYALLTTPSAVHLVGLRIHVGLVGAF